MLAVLFAAFFPPLLSWFYWQTLIPSLGLSSPVPWVIAWFLSAGACACGLLFIGQPERAAGAGLSALAALITWWWRRRKNRLRALRQFGEKSLARLAALARNMPRPSPRLMPEGVPA